MIGIISTYGSKLTKLPSLMWLTGYRFALNGLTRITTAKATGWEHLLCSK